MSLPKDGNLQDPGFAFSFRLSAYFFPFRGPEGLNLAVSAEATSSRFRRCYA
jgi:hypothetical protein